MKDFRGAVLEVVWVRSRKHLTNQVSRKAWMPVAAQISEGRWPEINDSRQIFKEAR